MSLSTLNNQDHPLLLCNVWDVRSASIAKELNFKAIGTSSAAIASTFGYSDGEQMAFEELFYIVERIIQNCDLPLTVDMEGGYSRDPHIVVDHIKRLVSLGVTGVNIEDSIVSDKRSILDKDHFSSFLDQVCNGLQKEHIDIFINVRTDTYLLNEHNRLEESILRARMYKAAGADGLFIPCITELSEIKELVSCIKLPLNVMFVPNLPSYEELTNVGVKRISMGNFIYNKMYDALSFELKSILENGINNVV